MALPLESIDPLRPVLGRRPLGLATDIDGTISPIADTPGEATVTPLCRRYLQEIARHVEVVAAMSGRTVQDARRLVGLEELTYVGNHGLSWWPRHGRGEETLAEAAPYESLVREARAGLAPLLNLPGLILEDKGPILAFHYRLSPDRSAARTAILAALAPWSERGLRLGEGRLVVELGPPLDVDKGTALARLMEAHRLGGVLYLGDDLTDVDAFRMVHRWRGEGKVAAAAVAVRNAESGPEVVEAADYWLDGVAGVEWLLGEVARAVGGRGP